MGAPRPVRVEVSVPAWSPLRLAPLALPILLAGCPSKETPDDSGAVSDRDGDGTPDAEDCAPDDALVNPDAAEVCDGVDNDCDGHTDPDTAEGAQSWYEDADHDGAGALASAVVSCEAPEGYVANASDCDDRHDTVAPGKPEVCDGLDNDCDGDTDPADAQGASPWYRDGDSDSFGDPAEQQLACEAPAGWVADATDCDDENADVHPGAAEVCNGYDDDCDEVVDPDTAEGAPTWYGDGDRDGYGGDEDVIVACDAPHGYVERGGDCDDEDNRAWPGGEEVCDGRDNDCDGFTDPSTSTDAAPWYGDADGDGYDGEVDVVYACDAPVGYGPSVTDCDDTRAEVHPGATESCDTLDNDCDGVVDPTSSRDAGSWHEDADRDGYGSITRVTIACEAPEGWLSDGSDCDDGSSAVRPDATERCNGTDDDCDGVVDPATSADAATWYRDADGDEHGNLSVTTTACTAPSGYVADDSDCDDTSAVAYPGATERCDDRDNDCDGTVDPTTSVDAGTWYLDGDIDGFGDDRATTRACDAPSGYVMEGGDCNTADSTVFPGAYDTPADGIDQDCDGADASCVDGDLGSATGLVVSGDTTGAGNDLSGSCGGSSGEDETWAWVAPATGIYRITTEGSWLDTVLYLQAGTCPDTSAEVECNDDMYVWLNGEITTELDAGTELVVVVDGYGLFSDTYDLRIDLLDPADCISGMDTDGDGYVDCLDPDCDAAAACDTSLASADLGSSTARPVSTGTTVGAPDNFGNGCVSESAGTAGEVILAWTAPYADQWTFDLAGSSHDSIISILDPDTLYEWGCDDEDFATDDPQLSAWLRAGQTVLIVIDGYGGAEGTYRLQIY